MGGVEDRFDRHARQPGRHRARPRRQHRHAGRGMDRRPAGRRGSPLRPRQGRSAGGAVPGRADHAIGRGHRLSRGRRTDLRGAGRFGRRRHRGVRPGDPRHLRAARLAATRHPLDRQHRDQDRQRPLQVGPLSQPRGDRRAGAGPLRRHCRGRSRLRTDHRAVARLGRVARIERGARPPDGQGMARRQARRVHRGAGANPGSSRDARPADPDQRRARFRPVPYFGRSADDGRRRPMS